MGRSIQHELCVNPSWGNQSNNWRLARSFGSVARWGTVSEAAGYVRIDVLIRAQQRPTNNRRWRALSASSYGRREVAPEVPVIPARPPIQLGNPTKKQVAALKGGQPRPGRRVDRRLECGRPLPVC